MVLTRLQLIIAICFGIYGSVALAGHHEVGEQKDHT